MNDTVRIVEVGPRDGLQNEAQTVSTATKLELIQRLVGAGLKNVEAAAFVSPKWVPQMADHAEVVAALPKIEGVTFPVLVPNMKGFEAAAAGGATEVAIFAAASEGFSRKNINCSIRESIERFVPVLAAARERGIRVRGYVSCVIACPYDGDTAPDQVAAVANDLLQLGCYEISLGDTIGVGTPASVRRMLEAVSRKIAVTQLAGHYHDTYGMAVANVAASYELGVRTFDSSISGLGGCPYAPGAAGNVATEDVIYLLNGMGVNTGVDLDRLVDCSAWISGVLKRAPASRVARAHRKARSRVIKLYHCMSARSFRPLWMMEELGLAYELVMLPFPPRVKAPLFLEQNPLGTIPLLIDGSTRMTESAAICQYLCASHAPTPLQVLPGEADFGAYLNYLHFGEATLTFPQALVLRYARFEPEHRRQPSVADDYTRWFLSRLRSLEPVLATREHLCAGRFTAADVSVGYALLLATHLGLGSRFTPSVAAYWDRLQQRAAYLRALQSQEQAALAQGVSTVPAPDAS